MKIKSLSIKNLSIENLRKLRWKTLAYAILFPFLLIFPLLTGMNAYIVRVCISAFIFGAMSVSLDILVGYTGLVSLGQATFLGLGAYGITSLIFLGVPFFAALFIIAIIAGIIGFVLCSITVRLTGVVLTISTLAFSAAFVYFVDIAISARAIITYPIPKIEIPGFAEINLNSPIYFYYICLTLLGITVFICEKIVTSRMGFALRAIREDELAASTNGVHVAKYKALAFFVSAALAGIAGGLYAPFALILLPDTFGPTLSIEALLMVVIGGRGTIIGPIFGAMILTTLPEVLRVTQAYSTMIVGIFFIFVAIFMPEGIVGALEKIVNKFRKHAR